MRPCEDRTTLKWDSESLCNAQRWNRTADTRIFSPLLYRLSYLGTKKLTFNNLPWIAENVKAFFLRRINFLVPEILERSMRRLVLSPTNALLCS